MARQQVQSVRNEDQFGDTVKGILPMVGNAVGSIYGGTAGGVAGGALGGEVSKGIGGSQASTVVESSPLSRRMEKLEQDPTNILRQGKQALTGMNEETRKAFEPVLDEALKKSAMSKQKQQGGF